MRAPLLTTCAPRRRGGGQGMLAFLFPPLVVCSQQVARPAQCPSWPLAGGCASNTTGMSSTLRGLRSRRRMQSASSARSRSPTRRTGTGCIRSTSARGRTAAWRRRTRTIPRSGSSSARLSCRRRRSGGRSTRNGSARRVRRRTSPSAGTRFSCVTPSGTTLISPPRIVELAARRVTHSVGVHRLLCVRLGLVSGLIAVCHGDWRCTRC